MSTFLGIDGGGTQTRAVIVDDRGQVLGAHVAGPSNYHSVGLDAAFENILAAADGARAKAGLPAAQPCDGACLGLAGCGGEEDRARLAPIAARLPVVSPQCVRIESDLFITHAGAFEGGPGIILIAGTGSSCFGIDATGKTARAGGWGPMFDDRGSAFDLGRQAIAHTLQAADGRGRASWLSHRITETLGGDLRTIARLTAQGDDRNRIAALAPLVFEAATRGEPAARQIIHDAARELAGLVHAVASHLHFPGEIALAIFGGLTTAGPALIDPLMAAIDVKPGRVKRVEGKWPAVMGAAMLARQMTHSRGE